jgi:hypothetical protein
MDTLARQIMASIPLFDTLPPWVILVICLGILLGLMAVILIWIRVLRRNNTVQPEFGEEVQKNPVEMSRQILRSRHQVRPLLALEETLELDKLPNGVYGFTLVPARLNSPVLKTPQPDLFEVHKTDDGAIVVLGFVSWQTASIMETACGRFQVNLSSMPSAEASVLVSIPMSRVIRHKQSCSRDESLLEMEVEPATKKWERVPLSRKPPEPSEVYAQPSQKARSA